MDAPEALPNPPKISEEQLRQCRESGDFCPILFQWYQFCGSLCVFLAILRRDSPAIKHIPPLEYHILIGLLNRCARLMLANVALSQEGLFGETTAIIDRCIFESAVKVRWLCETLDSERFRRFLADGLKTELEFKERINTTIGNRSGERLLIEDRMLKSIANHIASSGLSEDDVIETKKLPDLASMIDALGHDRLHYLVGQKMGSHAFHYVETSRISNAARKVRLGAVMWRFSRGTTIVGYPVIVRHELEVALAKRFAQVTPGNMPILGYGHSHAFGTPPLEGLLAQIAVEVERTLLMGSEVLGLEPPTSHLAPYRENFREHLASLHARQKDVPKDLRENWLYAMSTVDILNPINDIMRKHNLPKEAMDGLGERGLKEVINDMPTRCVDLHLHKQVLRNPNCLPRSTDLEDWGGLVLASCYCDVLVCEKHMADMLRRDGFATRARIEVDLERIFTPANGA